MCVPIRIVTSRYFTGKDWKWNNFDFIIVFLNLPLGLFSGGNAIKLLRLVRLARLGKLIRKIPALQMLVSGLIGGMKSISYIVLLLFLAFYLYGVMGFYLFQFNDPYHFGTLPLSMLTLFRITAYDGWSDLIYQNLFGCTYYPDMYVSDTDRTPFNRKKWCPAQSRADVPNPILTTLYFVSFIVVTAFVMLSLFIGAVSLSMNESMAELKNIAIKKQQLDAFNENKKKMAKLQKAAGRPSSRGNTSGRASTPTSASLLIPDSRANGASMDTRGAGSISREDELGAIAFTALDNPKQSPGT